MSTEREHDDDRGVIRALIAGVLANFGLGVVKLIAWFFTQSSAMLAEGLHSMADSSNQFLLLTGLKRSKKQPTETHPFGYTKEVYFWSFLVALLIFLVGGAFAIYEGIHKIQHPEPIKNVAWIYVALTLGLIFEGYALKIAYQEFQHFRAENPGPFWKNLMETKDPTLPTVLFEDSAAILGLLIALVGVTLAKVTGNGIWDGLASVLIGLVLVSVSWFLARESHSLLVGEAASEKDRAEIHAAVDAHPDVERCIELLTLQRSPTQVLVALTLRFREDLTVVELESAIVKLEADIRERISGAPHIFIEAGSLRTQVKPEDED